MIAVWRLRLAADRNKDTNVLVVRRAARSDQLARLAARGAMSIACS